MKKLTLTGMGQKEGYFHFTFEKDVEFFPLFIKLFGELDLEDTGSFYEHKDEPKLMEMPVDIVERSSNDKYDIEIFYGKDRIILTVRTDPKNREEIISKIQAISKFEDRNF